MDKIVNLLQFEEDCEGVKEEIIDVGEEKGNDLAIIAHTSSNSTSLNKRDLSEIDIIIRVILSSKMGLVRKLIK